MSKFAQCFPCDHVTDIWIALITKYHPFPSRTGVVIWWSASTHYSEVIKDAMTSQISSLNRLFKRRSKKLQSSASLAFVRGIHRWPVNSSHKWPVTRKMFPFDDVIMEMYKGYMMTPWRGKLSVVLTLCEGNPAVTGVFFLQRFSDLDFRCFLCGNPAQAF